VTTETWLLDSILASRGDYIELNISFTSNSTKYSTILVSDDVLTYGSEKVYDSGWTNQAYRTITFDQSVTDSELLDWLQTNGTKQ